MRKVRGGRAYFYYILLFHFTSSIHGYTPYLFQKAYAENGAVWRACILGCLPRVSLGFKDEIFGKFHWGTEQGNLGCQSLRWILSATTRYHSLGFPLLLGKVRELGSVLVSLCIPLSMSVSGCWVFVYNPQSNHIGSHYWLFSISTVWGKVISTDNSLGCQHTLSSGMVMGPSNVDLIVPGSLSPSSSSL